MHGLVAMSPASGNVCGEIPQAQHLMAAPTVGPEMAAHNLAKHVVSMGIAQILTDRFTIQQYVHRDFTSGVCIHLDLSFAQLKGAGF